MCTGGCTDNVCAIDCSGSGTCDGRTIVCPPEYACRVICDGTDACDNGRVTCPPSYACTVVCRGGHDACGNMELTCGAASCVIECANDACSGADVGCGSGPCTATCEGTPHPTLLGCSGSCGCDPC